MIACTVSDRRSTAAIASAAFSALPSASAVRRARRKPTTQFHMPIIIGFLTPTRMCTMPTTACQTQYFSSNGPASVRCHQ